MRCLSDSCMLGPCTAAGHNVHPAARPRCACTSMRLLLATAWRHTRILKYALECAYLEVVAAAVEGEALAHHTQLAGGVAAWGTKNKAHHSGGTQLNAVLQREA